MSAKPNHSGTANSDQQFWLLFAHSNVGMAIVLPDGRFQRANPEFCRLLNYSEAQLKLLDVQTVTHRDDLSAEMRLIKAGLQGKSPSYSLEKRFVRNDGTIVIASASSTLVHNPAGTPLHSIYTAHAILPLSMDDGRRTTDDAPLDTQHPTPDTITHHLTPWSTKTASSSSWRPCRWAYTL